jgi:hypothetical protein
MKTWEEQYNECLEKLTDSKAKYKHWSTKYTNLCYKRYVENRYGSKSK